MAALPNPLYVQSVISIGWLWGARAGILTEGAQCPQSPTPSLPNNAPGTQASNVELSLGHCGLREEEIIENHILSEESKFYQI